MDFKYLFFSFDGRINRAKWWLGLLILVIAQWVVMLILGSVLGMSMTGSFDPNNPDAMAGQMMGMMIPMVVIGLLFLYPALAVYTKRWHDRNKSGWWTLILFVPIVGGIWMLVECGILPGTNGPNRYGPDPLQQ